MWGFLRIGKSKSSTRAERFPVHIPISFRKPGQFAWLVGRTTNISRSGIVFRAGRAMRVDTRVEMQFVAPAEIGNEAGELVSCLGKIVRVDPPTDEDKRPALAAKFLQYDAARIRGDW